MSLQQLRKEIEILKNTAASQIKKQSEVDLSKLTDEELRQAIEEDIHSLGFESSAYFLECAKNFILEKDLNANVSHEFAIISRVFELFEDFKMWEEFMQKYSSLELTE